MAIIKSYTDLEQSKVLSKILPIESADMTYTPIIDIGSMSNSGFLDIPDCYPFNRFKDSDIKPLPCWSLAALYNILPNSEYITTTLSRGGWKVKNPVEFIDGWYCEYEDENDPGNGITVLADNPVDACVAMIENLHELNLL